jgi:Leucine-rich repeat (LRR) protein
LADITSLEKLDLEGTSVSDISFISSLNNLNWVNLMSTNVVSVSSLANHPTLKRVELRNNDIVGDCPDMFDSGFENIAIIC